MESAPVEKMSIGNKIFYVVFFAAILISVGVTFYKIVILKDYQIEAQTSCDPKIEKCFVTECDPATDNTCSVHPEERITYYKKISKKAANIVSCELTSNKIGCSENLSCIDGEAKCSYTLCDPANLGDGEKCSE